MKVLHLRLVICVLFGLPPLAAAQPPAQGEAQPRSQGDGQSVTVTGERPSSEAERRREASRFFDSHAVRTRIGQLARWHRPICVRAGGLPPALNARIATRIMDIADSVGVRVNRAELCAPNIRIGFTTEPRAMVERAVRRNPLVIGFHYARQRDEVMRVRQPVQAWYVTTTISAPGSGAMDPEGYRPEAIDQAGIRAPGGRAGSRLSAEIKSGLAHVLIFADSAAVTGQDADAIAGLLAFLALAQTPVADACDPSDTILNLMNPACPADRRPLALTRQDIAWLRALYSVDPSWGPPLQRGAVVLDMADRLGGGR